VKLSGTRLLCRKDAYWIWLCILSAFFSRHCIEFDVHVHTSCPMLVMITMLKRKRNRDATVLLSWQPCVSSVSLFLPHLINKKSIQKDVCEHLGRIRPLKGNAALQALFTARSVQQTRCLLTFHYVRNPKVMVLTSLYTSSGIRAICGSWCS